MARKTGFRWEESYRDEFERAVKNYNQRVRRANKKYGFSIPTFTAKSLKSTIKSKRKFNYTINKLNRARADTLKPTKDKKESIYERNERNLEKKRKSHKPTIKPTVSPVKSVDEIRKENLNKADLSKRLGRFLNDRDFIVAQLEKGEGTSLERTEQYVEDNRRRLEIWKENYLNAIDKVTTDAAIQGATDAVEAFNELRRLITSMDLTDFLIGQLAKPDDLSIKEIYDYLKEGAVESINMILTDWKQFVTS